MKEEILKIDNLSKNFVLKSHLKALKNISISVKKGEFVCILGPSGCGKTVFLHLIAGFLEPTGGQIILEGKVAKRPNVDRILVFQDYVLFPWMTVYNNILFGLEKDGRSLSEKKKLTNRYLKMAGLEKFRDQYPATLSGGTKQRVAIVRALISDPKILLMDEPFAALDPQNRKYLRKRLEKVWEKTKKTIIFVTHSVNEAVDLADTIYLFSSSPAKVKKIYHLNLPRPRDKYDPKFIKIARQIEKEIASEFRKTFQ
jgi:NitT/TauT family transport system ATP-binding protein